MAAVTLCVPVYVYTSGTDAVLLTGGVQAIFTPFKISSSLPQETISVFLWLKFIIFVDFNVEDNDVFILSQSLNFVENNIQ